MIFSETSQWKVVQYISEFYLFLLLQNTRWVSIFWGLLKTKHINRGSQDGLRSLLWGWHILMSQGCTILCLPNKILSCNTSLTIQIFTAERTEEINTIPTYLGLWLECRWLTQPQQGPSKVEAKHRRPQPGKSSPCGSRTQRKPRAVEVRRSPAC